VTKPALKLPDSKGGWASLILGFGLCFVGIAHALMGDYEQAWLDWAGAFGTLGLPALVGKGYHVEIRKDAPVNTSPPEGFAGVHRLESNDDVDPAPKPQPFKAWPQTEVRRADEHEH
jgi:hypothetical protein